MSNVDVIQQFLAGKGLSKAAIAGIIGNLQVESGFNPEALNTAEGAIGIGQWEGGRRTALDAYAKSQGTSETDLTTQLNFMWQELTTSKSSVLTQLKTVTDPAQAATIWDADYEISSGSSRTQRIENAQSYYSGVVPQGSSGAQVTSAAASTADTADTYKQAMASLSGLFTTVPELQTVLNQAVAGQWTTDRFEQAIDATTWYRSNAATVRTQLALQSSDPATYQQNLNQAGQHVLILAGQMGINMSFSQALSYAQSALFGNLSDEALRSDIGQTYSAQNPNGATTGDAAQLQQQIQAMAADYGVPVTQTQVNTWIQGGLGDDQTATETLAGVQQSLMNQAATAYPPIAQQIMAGQTVKDIAQPYIAQMAQTLEIPDTNITLQDPTIQKALSNPTLTPPGKTTAGSTPPTPTLGSAAASTATPSTSVAGSSATPGDTSMPLWQFTNQLRLDPRWQQTDNAKQSAYSMTASLGKEFGFST